MPMSAFLPQHDPHPQQRAHGLAGARAEYRYNHQYLAPLAMVERVPFHEKFGWRWLVQMGEHVMRAVENRLQIEGDAALRARHQQHHLHFIDLIRRVSFDIRDIVQLLKETVGAVPVNGRAEDPGEFDRLFRALGLPPIAKDYQIDGVFAEMRVAGPNPVMLRRIAHLDDRFPVTEEHYQLAVLNDTLAAAGAEGRLYLADYQLLEQVENGTFPDAQKYVYAPLALFAVPPGATKLVPVAIQCRQEPGPDNPIFTPDDGYNWLIAKTIVEIADGNIHESVAHLGRTHLLMEPFVIATHRQLAANHPLNLLLEPHFEGTLAINHMAHTHLVADRGACDQLMGGTIASTRGLAVKGVQTYPFRRATLPRVLAEQGLDDATLLPHYPYRDDALLYWHAIHQWVADYLAIYYPTDADLQQDSELKNWLAELAAPDGGAVVGLDFNGQVPDRSALADMVALIIFTCSAQHAAVNFPQGDLMSYVPNMPLAGYAPAPNRKDGGTLADYLAMLPPRHTAEIQVELGYLLGAMHYTTLGHYGRRHFRDPRVARPLENFEKQLFRIGQVIAARNQVRRPYTYLSPEGVPQSINV
jgi:arachidonate 15-lipoxygenase